MEKNIVEQVKNDPNYHKLVSRRSSFSIKLSLSILVVYFTFILTIAFNPSLLAIPISSDSVTTIGVPIGISIIVFSFVLTGVYTKRANSEFDDLVNKIKDAVKDN